MYGAGILDEDTPVENCTVVDNYGNAAGGGFKGAKLYKNCIFWNNSCKHGISNIPYSSKISYCCIQDFIWDYYDPLIHEGIITDDPEFINQNNGDYRLKSSSPCIDTGDPGTEYNDACLPPGKGEVQNDMGAYGGPYNCAWKDIILKPYLINHYLQLCPLSPDDCEKSDLNQDGVIDICDLVLMINQGK